MSTVKKVLISAILCSSLGQALAASSDNTVKSGSRLPDFKDYFEVTGASVQNIATVGNLKIVNKSQNSFIVAANDVHSYDYGFVNLVVSQGAGICELKIQDGPLDMNPSVISAQCNKGLDFSGVDHPYGSYRYTLKFYYQATR